MQNELEQKIRKAIPKLNELGVGCEIKYGSETIYVVSSMQKDFIYLISKDNISNRKMITIYDDRIEIIGKPIQINHVLEYLFHHRKYAVNDTQIIDLLERYNYLESFQNQQSELIKFINEL